MLQSFSKHAAAADSKVELTWADVRCHKYFQRTNIKNLSTSTGAQSAALQRHQRSLERPSECAAGKCSTKKYTVSSESGVTPLPGGVHEPTLDTG